MFLSSVVLYAQPGDPALKRIWRQGLPFITNYTTDDYKAELQNWAIIQDDQGVMYFANNSGILQFDGASWRLIKTPGESTIRSFAKDSHGRIYVGGIGEVGYLEPEARRGMVFHPLQQQLDSTYRDFGNVWFTYAIRDTIYFVCDNYIMRWQDGRFHVIQDPDHKSFGFAWVIRDRLYVDVYGRGLKTVDGEALRMIRGGEAFYKKAVMGLLPLENDRMIAFTTSRAILEYDGTQLIPFKRGGAELQLRDAVYQSIALSTGDYALATTGSGFYTMDKSGKILTNVTKQEGLSSDALYAVYEDAEGDIWLATDNGISRLEINSPLRVLNAYHGVDENPYDIEYFNDRIYITNSKGLFQLTEEQVPLSASRLSFKKIKGIDNLTLGCHHVGDELLISNYDGIFTLDRNNRVTNVMPYNVSEMESPSSPDQDHMVFEKPGQGIAEVFREPNGRWTAGKETLDISASAYSFARSNDGSLFIDTHRNGVYEVAWTDPGGRHRLSDGHKLIHHTPDNGLASLNVKALARIGNQIYVSTVNTVQHYNDTRRVFEIDTLITAKIQQYTGAWVNEIAAGAGQHYWLSVYENFESHIFKGQPGSLEELEVSGRFSDALTTKVFDTKRGLVLFGSNKSIVLYDEDRPIAYKNTFKTLIRGVAIEQDSVIYAGHADARAGADIEIPYSGHDLRFRFSLPSYDLSAHTRYQYYLEGFADDWSSWSTESTVDFTNLAEGNYIFHVRGKNVYGHVSDEDRFAFTILPPWYRTWWAYGLYALLLVGVISLVASWRARKLKQEKIELEKIILDRTQTILQQTEELKEMDRVKSRFFANISHEFRTPLTLILSPLEEEIAKRATGRESLMLVQRNANRLLELVNQLLDLSKLEAGKMQLQLRPGDLPAFLRIISAPFDSLAEHKQITFVKTLEVPEGTYKYDADKLEKVVINLLANAFKFTSPQGSVVFAASCRQQSGGRALVLQVSDTGMGIAPEEHEHIFDSFYQTNEGHEGGTGLGLSLVKELVKLYKGHISLESTVGKGTTFVVEIPLDGDMLSTAGAAHPIVAVPERAPIGADPAEEEAEQAQQYPERDTILVVEDNADLRNYISAFLEKEFAVVTASNGKDALDIACKAMPDLVLSDLMMPLMNGLQLTEKIKTDDVISHIPVILLTAKNEHESRIEGLRTGADDYLTKPFSNEELLVRIRNLISQRKKLAERYRERILMPMNSIEEPSLDDKFLHRAKEVVEANMSDVQFTVEKMADEMHLSRTQLLRKLKSLTGLSPNEFIKDLRLRRAADMIRQKADTITQIGYAVGFNDQSYFTKCFKKQFKVTPTEYAQQEAG